MRLHRSKAGGTQEEDGSIKILVKRATLVDWDDCDGNSWSDCDHFYRLDVQSATMVDWDDCDGNNWDDCDHSQRLRRKWKYLDLDVLRRFEGYDTLLG